VATIVVGKWCGLVDESRLAEHLAVGPELSASRYRDFGQPVLERKR
jgi:hypothetical protein